MYRHHASINNTQFAFESEQRRNINAILQHMVTASHNEGPYLWRQSRYKLASYSNWEDTASVPEQQCNQYTHMSVMLQKDLFT